MRVNIEPGGGRAAGHRYVTVRHNARRVKRFGNAADARNVQRARIFVALVQMHAAAMELDAATRGGA